MPARWMDYVPLDDLQRAPRNPKNHDSELIAKSLSRHGYVEPITLDERTGRLVAGHGRLDDLEARRAKGEPAPDGVEVRDGAWFVPVARGWSSKDDAQAAAYLVTSNQTTIAGGWDMPELMDVLSGLAEVNVDELVGTGFGTADIDDLIASLQPKADSVMPRRSDPDDAPDVPESPVSAPGDVWVLGPHKLAVGKAEDAELMAGLMGSDTAAVLWTDPPYGVKYVGKTAAAMSIENDALDDGGLRSLLTESFQVASQHLQGGGRVYVAHPPGRLSAIFTAAFVAQWHLHEGLVWLKDSMVLGHSDYHYRHEPLLFGYKAGSGRWGRGGQGWYGSNSETSVIEVPRPKASHLHPTMKPVALVERCLVNSSQGTDVVLDPFAGSGSTLLAAHRLGRQCRAVELDCQYADVICRRFQEHTGIVPVLEATGEPHDFTVAAPAEPVSP